MQIEMNKSPLTVQYKQLKVKYPDAILLFRVGSFYEAFREDAVNLNKVLGITLTKRGGEFLAGFPYSKLDDYLPKLVRRGYRVAICEQIEKKEEKQIKPKQLELWQQ